ncbi:MAG: TolC family protein [Elusimicrobiota bacterium]
MKKFFYLLPFTFYLLPFTCLYSQQLVERVLTVDDSVNLAISNNQQLLSARQDIEIARQRLKEARSIMYPQLEFNANYSKFKAESPLLISPILGNTILPQKIEPLVDNIEDYYTAKISLYQILWSGAKISATKKFAETELKSAESDYEVIKNKTGSSAKKNFYTLLSIQKKVEIYKATIEKISNRKNESLNPKDRFISEKKIEKIKSAETKNQKELELAEIDFLDSIGIELNTIFTIKGELEHKKAVVDLNKCIAWALEYRPELKKTQLQEQMDALSVNLSLSGRYPIITLGGNYQLEDRQLPFEKRAWNATINFTLPIFDGFGQFARIKQKKYQYRKTQINRASITDSIQAEVRKCFVDYEFAVKKFEQKTNEKEQLATTVTDEVLKELTYLEFIEMLETAMNIQLEYIDALKDVIIAKINLETSIGKIIE